MEPSPLSSSSSSSQITEESSNRFSHDISQMPDFPTRNLNHRRAQSETLSLPDDLTFDFELGVEGAADEAEEDLLAMYLDFDKIGGEQAAVYAGGGASSSSSLQNENMGGERNERPRVRHRHSQSMDGSSSIKSELLGTSSDGPASLAEAKKSMSDAKLRDLALVDPRRAKRIWANRQSAARSKERKMRYIAELERKLQTLQSEATTLSAQLTMLQRDATGLTSENSELKVRLQSMEQQVHLQDALNDALREEVQQLKLVTGQMMPNGPMMSLGANQQQFQRHLNHNQAMHSLMAAQQLQQLQIHPQHHQHQRQHPPPDFRMRGMIPHQNQREIG